MQNNDELARRIAHDKIKMCAADVAHICGFPSDQPVGFIVMLFTPEGGRAWFTNAAPLIQGLLANELVTNVLQGQMEQMARSASGAPNLVVVPK